MFVLGTITAANSLDITPQLECLENAMRLHFVPEMGPNVPAFGGHVYLKGFFFTEHCHLDYTRQAIDQPFYFHIPFRSECQVKRERSIEGENGRNVSGLSYSTIVIVQHHRLFVTNRDKAYAVNCFYREAKGLLERKLEVGDLPPFDVNGTKEAPVCTYEVLKDGEAIRYANVGDVLVHRWSCDTEELGMLVHSCIIRDGLGHSFALLDQRGCVTDSSLLAPLTYTGQLNSSSTPINTFKYADQMIVYFGCQITLCDKRENGCEGITPPICELTPLPSEGGPEMPVVHASRDHPALAPAHRVLLRNPSRGGASSSLSASTGGPDPSLKAWGRVRNVLNDRDRRWVVISNGIQRLGHQKGGRWTREIGRGNRTVMQRTAHMELRIGNGTDTGDGHGRHKLKKHKELITVDVVADRLIVFTTDEGPTVAEKTRLATDGPQKFGQQGSNFVVECEAPPFSWWPIIWTASAFLLLGIIALLVQWHFFRRKLITLGTYAPNCNSGGGGGNVQFEMAGMPSFLGTTPNPVVAINGKYGRFG
uniref:ZP domain-containing protein n=1 Tax=Globodera rostochiensis TaxID=31243 RepID=A0A914H3P7_GLORO